ncbi:MAG: hypothetical protein JXA23_10010, partial [Bacteroidales bacterium]|nr:hypothetical protein [Bacteroidales bacterium]
GAWKESSGSSDTGSLSDAFISRIFTCDRLITVTGYRIFPLHQGTLSGKAITGTLDKISRFLGFDLPSRMPAIGNDIPTFANQSEMADSPVQPDDNPSLLTELNARRRPGEAREIIRCQAVDGQNPLAMQALYTGRWPGLPHPEAYVQAALTGYKVWLASAGILTVQDGLDLVNAIPGRESIFGSSGRIALPDEVLLFQTGNANERELLLYALLQLSEAIPDNEKPQDPILP